jgi:hypothetical protein
VAKFSFTSMNPISRLKVASTFSILVHSVEQAFYCFSLTGLVVSTVRGAEPDLRPHWSLSVGTEVRSIGVGFLLGAPVPPNTAGVLSLRRSAGLGDVGVATNGSQTVFYEDGSVGTDGTGKGRDSSFSVDSASQVVFGTRAGGADFATTGSATFHSSGISYAQEQAYTNMSYEGEDNAVVIGPHLELRCELFNTPLVSAGFSIGWSFFDSTHRTGLRTVASLAINEIETRNNYTYIYSLPESADRSPTGFPPNYDNTQATGVVYNANAYNTFSGFSPGDPEYVHAPITQATSSRNSSQIALLEARSSASLRLQTQVLPFLLDSTFHITPRFAAGIAAGPTLNVVSHHLNTQTEWLLNGAVIQRQQDASHGTHVATGATLRGAISMALTPDSRWSLEAGFGWDWVPSHKVEAGTASAEIDLSSWVSSIGVRFVF